MVLVALLFKLCAVNQCERNHFRLFSILDLILSSPQEKSHKHFNTLLNALCIVEYCVMIMLSAMRVTKNLFFFNLGIKI